jgi:hypothetical protein
MSATQSAPGTTPGEDDLKLYETYADGKMKRYTLLFAVNGGALAIAQAYHAAGLLGMLTVRKLAVGAIAFSWLMLWDIWAFGEMMRRRYDAGWKAEDDPRRLKVFTPIGKLILFLLVGLLSAAWVFASLDAGATSGTTG